MDVNLDGCIMCGEPTPGKFCSCRCEQEYNFQNRTCPVCYGEFWDGGTSCTCEDWEEHEYEEKRHPLKGRFPDYYEHSQYYDAGARNASSRFLFATRFAPRKKKKRLLKRIAKGCIKNPNDLPF